MPKPTPQRSLTLLVIGVAIAIGRVVVGCLPTSFPIPRIDTSPSALVPFTTPGDP